MKSTLWKYRRVCPSYSHYFLLLFYDMYTKCNMPGDILDDYGIIKRISCLQSLLYLLYGVKHETIIWKLQLLQFQFFKFC